MADPLVDRELAQDEGTVEGLGMVFFNNDTDDTGLPIVADLVPDAAPPKKGSIRQDDRLLSVNGMDMQGITGIDLATALDHQLSDGTCSLMLLRHLPDSGEYEEVETVMEVSLYPPATLVPDGAGLVSQTARESSSLSMDGPGRDSQVRQAGRQMEQYQHAVRGQDESEAWLEDTGQQHHHPPESYVQQQQQQRVREGASVPSGHGQPQPGLQPRVEIDWNGTVKARVPVAGTIARTGGSIAQPSLYEAQSTAIHASRSGQPEAVGPSSAAQRLQKTLSGQHDKQTQQPRPAPQQPAPQAQSVPADGRAEYARENTLPGMYDRRAQTRVKASVGGPGLVLGQVEGKVVVLGLIPHLPAALSGVIQVNDEITEVDSFGIEQVTEGLGSDVVMAAEHEAAWLRGQPVTSQGVLSSAVSNPDPDSRALSLCRSLIRAAGETVRLTVRRPTFDPRKQAGVGLLLNITVNGIFVVGVAPLSSAEREGSVMVGDTLLAIGDRVLEGMTTDSLVKLLVGPQGSAITLTLRRSALPSSTAAGVPPKVPSGGIYRCSLLRGTEDFLRQLDALYHGNAAQAAGVPTAARGAAGARVRGEQAMLAAMGHAPYSELKSLVDAHIHRAQWFQVDLDLRSRAAALGSHFTGGRTRAERAIAADLQLQVDTLQKQVTEVGQLESIRRQELAELQSKGPPMEVDSSAVEPLLLQVKEVIDELIRVEQGVTSWEQRAADVDKERARLASEAEAERLVRVQQNQGAREQALVQGNLDNNLRRQRAQWEHQRQELVMEASRIRHARISTERVLQETKDTLRTLAAEMEHFLYTVIMGEKKIDEAHGKLLHLHTLAQAVTLDIDAQMRSQGGVPGLSKAEQPSAMLQPSTARNVLIPDGTYTVSPHMDALGLEPGRRLSAKQGWPPNLSAGSAPVNLAGQYAAVAGYGGGSSGLDSLDLARPGPVTHSLSAPLAVRDQALAKAQVGDSFLSRVGLGGGAGKGMTDRLLSEVVRAGGRAEVSQTWLQDFHGAPRPGHQSSSDSYQDMPTLPKMESGLFTLNHSNAPPAIQTHLQEHMQQTQSRQPLPPQQLQAPPNGILKPPPPNGSAPTAAATNNYTSTATQPRESLLRHGTQHQHAPPSGEGAMTLPTLAALHAPAAATAADNAAAAESEARKKRIADLESAISQIQQRSRMTAAM